MLDFLSSQDELLRLLALKRPAFDQRVMMGQAAFVGGRKPAHVGEYLALDAVFMMLVGRLHEQGLKLEDAAEIVLRFWKELLTLVAQAERQEHPPLFFAVAVSSPDPDGSYDSSLPRRVAFGNANEIVEALYPADGVAMIRVHGVLRRLRDNARHAKPKITLPERFAVAEDDPGYENWRREVDAYRERAEMRLHAKAKTKAKGRRKREKLKSMA